MVMYEKVYDFTNENVSCLKDLYHFEKAKVLSVVGSGDHYFSSVLNGAKQVDLFDINYTSYLYFLFKFYSIRELTYEEFYDILVLKNFGNIQVYKKLESVLPIEVLKYYKYLMLCTKKNKNIYFRKDGIDILSKRNKKYYFKNNNTVISYFLKDKYYKLQEKLKKMDLPNFFKTNLMWLNCKINENYDILLTSNVYDYVLVTPIEYVEKLKNFEIPEIEVYYDWHGKCLEEFIDVGCSVNRVLPSAPNQYSKKLNYIYSLKK